MGANKEAFVIGGMIFRLYVSGKLVDEIHVTEANEQSGLERARWQGDKAVDAEQEGKVWCLEIFDPDAPLENAYIRTGTDISMMKDPQEVAPSDEGEFVESIGQRFRQQMKENYGYDPGGLS